MVELGRVLQVARHRIVPVSYPYLRLLRALRLLRLLLLLLTRAYRRCHRRRAITLLAAFLAVGLEVPRARR